MPDFYPRRVDEKYPYSYEVEVEVQGSTMRAMVHTSHPPTDETRAAFVRGWLAPMGSPEEVEQWVKVARFQFWRGRADFTWEPDEKTSGYFHEWVFAVPWRGGVYRYSIYADTEEEAREILRVQWLETAPALTSREARDLAATSPCERK